MFQQTIIDLWHGFGVALEPHNLMWALFGVLVGNMVGVLPGLGALSAISILLPLTFVMHAVPALMMLAGIFYGCIYGGAIGAILLNLPTHPPHAVTCIDGYPMTKQGRGGAALGITMLASFFAASVGILVMIFFSPILVKLAFKFTPGDIFSVMLLGLIAGSTMSGGSPLKGIAMTLIGMLCGVCGTDVNTGAIRITFGQQELADGVGLVAICMGLFGVADFLLNVNRANFAGSGARIRWRDMRPSKSELRQSIAPMLRGTLVGTLFGALPGTGPTVTTFIAYALERKIARDPERFGKGAIEGVASPEASSHAKTQVDFIPTMCLGIPGDSVMALLLGALMIQGIAPGPQLISEHPDLFWGLILPHGLLELTAVFVAAGVGLRIGWAWIAPGPVMTRGRAVAQAARSAMMVALGLVVMLAVSGLIEAFVTPSGLPTAARIGVGALAELGFFSYVFIAGRRAYRAGEIGDVSAIDQVAELPAVA